MIEAARQLADDAAIGAVRFDYAVRHSGDHRRRGGDFVAYQAGSDCFNLAVGDVSAKESRGHTLAHAMRSSFRRTMRSRPSSPPSKILAEMSHAFIDLDDISVPSPTFVAALVVNIDLRRGLLSYAAAGTEGGMLFSGRSHEHLQATGPLIGIEENPTFEDHARAFFPDDVLLAYNDGVTDALAEIDRRPFGSLGLVRCLSRPRAPEGLTIHGLWGEIDRFTGRSYNDDATLAVVHAGR
jgi:serine phosphatase RsbU (regulator of sigma subunit)